MNLTELLCKSAAAWPQKAALVEEDSVLSYAGLAARAEALSNRLKGLGFPASSRVGLCFPNGFNYVALTFALWRLGHTVVPIPVEYADAEQAELARAMQLGGMLSSKTGPGAMEIESGIYFTPLAFSSAAQNPELNLAFIRFTSGTTSASKGVALSHQTIADRMDAANEALRITVTDTVIWCLPMAHHFLVTIVLYLSRGATIVLARHLLAGPFLAAIIRHQGTVLYAAPFHYSMLAQDQTGAAIPSVRLAVSTTCPLPAAVAESFRARFNLPLVQALGVIEAGLVCVNTEDAAGRWNSVGRPLSKFAVHIRDADEEGFGDVLVAGPGMFDAYANPWTPRDQIMPDGWFATGDIGRLDEAGFLFLAGRKVAVINLAGRKVFPEEIESVLNRHPAVVESRVFGAPHPHLGEVVTAEVVLRETASVASLREFCREWLSPDKVPAHFDFVAQIARTTVTRKIRRLAAAPPA